MMLLINLKIHIIHYMIMCITNSGVLLYIIHHDTLYTKWQGLEY
jgi:hypothetical protein